MSKDRIKPHVRTVIISDLHLGTIGCQARELRRFLKSMTFDKLILAGDIVDFWNLSRSCWSQTHSDVLRTILKLPKKGVEVVYLPGNHDEAACDLIGFIEFDNFRMAREYLLETADGKRYLIFHGDQFDLVLVSRLGRWVACVAGWAYDLIIAANHYLNRLGRLLRLGPFSLSKYVKTGVKQAAAFIGDFEHLAATHARERGADGIICGHIHVPAEAKPLGGLLYYNTGDWVECRTAVIEHFDGRLELVQASAADDESGLDDEAVIKGKPAPEIPPALAG